MSNKQFRVSLPTLTPPVGLAWGSKAPVDVLEYVLECKDWLDASDVALVAADVYASPGLIAGEREYELTGNSLTGVQVKIGGGVPGADERVRFLLRLTDDQVLEAVVTLPIRAAAPAGLLPIIGAGTPLTVGGVQITVGGQPIIL